MAAIVHVTNNVTKWDASQLNQYNDALSNIFGISDTAQDALGRLVIPHATSNPGTPSVGMINFRTDLNLPYIYDANGNWVPIIALKQRVTKQLIGVQAVGVAAWTDIGGFTLNIVTTGGRLKIYFAAESIIGDTSVDYVFARQATGDTFFRAVVDAVALTPYTLSISSGAFTAPGEFGWGYTPAAGAHTVKIQGNSESATNLQIGGYTIGSPTAGLTLVVEEWWA